MKTLLQLLAVWFIADAVHYLWIAVRQRRWERKIQRDVAGVREGALAYTCGAGPVAVLWVHGFADTPTTFQRMASRLSASGTFTCRAMRLPGAGEPTAQTAKITLADWRAAVAREIAELRQNHEQIWLIGHSLGGALALNAALRSPADVTGVVALSPLIQVSRRRSPILPPHVWFRLANASFPFSKTFESCFKVNAVAADDTHYTYIRDRFIPFATYRNLFALIKELQPRAAEMRVPVLALLAVEDRVVDTPAAQKWFADVTSPKQVRLLPDVAHELPLENGWEKTSDEIAAFILKKGC
jgi:carboxylesterase